MGHVFHNRCDTEAIIHAWESWGPDCLLHLSGMFAFALWDRKQETLFLARDRMKTLESERALKQSGQVTSSSDPNVVEFKGADFFLTGKLEGLSTRTSAGTSDYILYSFQLIDARTSDIIWEDSAEIKKQGLEDAAYR